MNIWQRILERLEDRVNAQSFSTWLRPTALQRDEGRRIFVSVPSELFANWLSRNYMDLIRESAGQLERDGVEVSFVYDERAAAFVARAFGFLTPMQRKPGDRRLALIEMLSLDPRRRIVLVRRDNKEHLILLSPTGETILESDIDVQHPLDAPMSGSTFLTIKTEPR